MREHGEMGRGAFGRCTGRPTSRAVLLVAALVLSTVGVGVVATQVASADTAVSLRIGDTTVVEGNGPQNTVAKLDLRLSAPLPTGICVWYATRFESARGAPNAKVHDSNHDFVVVNNRVVKIPAGKVLAALSTTVLYDSQPEPDETYSLDINRITAMAGTRCGDDPVTVDRAKGSGRVTIHDDDGDGPTGPVLRLGSPTVIEGNGNQNVNAYVPLSLSSTFPTAKCVWYHTDPGSGGASGAPKATVHDGSHDYLSRANRFVKIAAGKSVGQIAVPVLYDTDDEADESFSVVVDRVSDVAGTKCQTAPDGVTQRFGDGATVVHIVDDDDGGFAGVPTNLVASADSGFAGYALFSFDPAEPSAAVATYLIQSSYDGGATWTDDYYVEPYFPGRVDSYPSCPGSAASCTYHVAALPWTGGQGPWSPPSNTLVPAPHPPAAPTAVSVAGNSTPNPDLFTGAYDVSWNAPSDHGSAAITGYTIEVSVDGGQSYEHLASTTDTHATVCCLSRVNAFQVRVKATNAVGDGPYGYSGPFQPHVDASTNVTLTVGAPDADSGLPTYTVSWTPSASSTWPIVSQFVQLNWDADFINNVAQVGADDSSVTLCCLTPGLTYKARIVSVTDIGTGQPSDWSNPLIAPQPLPPEPPRT